MTIVYKNEEFEADKLFYNDYNELVAGDKVVTLDDVAIRITKANDKMSKEEVISQEDGEAVVRFNYGCGQVEMTVAVYGEYSHYSGSYYEPEETVFICDGISLIYASYSDSEVEDVEVEIEQDVLDEFCGICSYER